MTHHAARVLLACATLAVAACGGSNTQTAAPPVSPMPSMPSTPPRMPDPRVGLKAGFNDAGEAVSNLRMLAKVPSPPGFINGVNSDISFTGNYAIQGNFNGLQVWDISNPANPTLVTAYPCPASQNDVSVYKHLLFMSAEANNGRLDCAPGGVPDTVSKDRIRGIRIFDITDIRNPKLVGNVQTCRGSHTHTVVEDPKDPANVYIYVSGSSPVRSPSEMPGCVSDAPDKNPNSSLMRIEIIKVPVAHPEQAAIVNRAQIFNDLKQPGTHGASPEDIAESKRVADSARRMGAFTAVYQGEEIVLGPGFTGPLLDSIVAARRGTGTPTAADSAALRAGIQKIIDAYDTPAPGGGVSMTSQCHDITVYSGIGLAGGACEGHGLLLDIRDPVRPVRIDAASDTNFAYWHSATFNNDGTKVLFSDEWGGGGAPKCRASDKREWGADAIFTIENRKLKFQSYYKLPAAQTDKENCVAHNGSLIPIPGRDVMVQAWYQGGISVFDWTDARHPQEIAYFDRGPIDANEMRLGGSWSVYWYNGAIVSSEIARGLDVAELVPSEYLSKNEIDAAKTVRYTYLNAQSQPKMDWPPSFPLASAYVDQLERSRCLSTARIGDIRQSLGTAERTSGSQRSTTLNQIVSQLESDAKGSCDQPRVRLLQKAVNDLSKAGAQ